MEQSFGADFSQVRVHEGSEAGAKGARAYAQGNDLHFGAGEFNPATPEGKELIGHELAHVVQQREGRVSGPQGKGGINGDPELEAEADAAGARAARGEPAGIGGGTASTTGTSSASAPIQLKKKGWTKGSELTSHKAGSKEAKQDYLTLMDGDDSTRVAKIAALFDGRSSSKNQRFYHLQMWLMGDNKSLESEYKQQTSRELRADLLANLTRPQYDYCRNLLMHGVPMMEDRVRLALGELTGTAVDAKEVLLLFMGNTDIEVKDDDKLRAWNNLKAELKDKLKGDKFDVLKTHIESIELGKGAELAKQGQGGQLLPHQRHAILDAKDREVTALMKAQKGSLAMKRDKLGTVLPDWARRQDDKTREYVTRDGSLFVTSLKAEIVKMPLTGVQILFTQHDVDYAIAMVRNGGMVDDKFFQDGESTDQMPTEKAAEKREEKRAEEGANFAEFVAYFERKEHNGADKKWQWGTLKEKVEEMSPEQRDWFVRSQLDDAEQKQWDDEDLGHGVRMKLRDQAVAKIEQRLKDMGMKGDGLLNRGGDSTRKKIVEAFRYGAAANTTSGGGTYQRILKHAKEEMDATKFGKQAVSLLRKVRGDEFAQIRGNRDLMRSLQQKASPKYWDRIQGMLGLTVDAKDDAKGTVDHDVLNAVELKDNSTGQGKHLGNKHDLEEARDLGEREAELMPSHWGLVLTAALKEARVLRRTEINSLVTRAYTAGKRREMLTQNGPLKLSGSRELAPMTASDFVKAVDASISAGGRQVLEKHKKGKLENAYQALKAGTRVSVDDQLEDGEFRNQMKRTSGFDVSMEAVAHTYEDLDGIDLLNEWSNIEEFREIKKQHDAEPDPQKKQALKTQLRDFVIDVREDRRAYLEDSMPRGTLVATLGKIRKKLAGAAASDAEMIKALRDEGFTNDEYSQYRTKNLMLLDQQKQRSTGAQYNTFLGKKSEIKVAGSTIIGANAASAEAKESTGILLGHTRKAQSDLREGVGRDQVLEDHGGDIKDAQEDLERRGGKFDKMQKAYNKVVEGLAKALVFAVAAAAIGAITLATGGVGGALAVGLIAGKTLFTSLVMAGVKKALQGDNFNGTKVFWDVAFKTFINTGFAAVGAFGIPALLEHLGEGITSVGDNLTSTTEFAMPQDAGHAAWRTALEFGLTKGAKGVFKEAIRAARDTDSNPAHRAFIMLHLGSVVGQLGAKIGASAFAEYNEDLQASSATDPEKKASAKFNKVLAKSPKAIKVGAKLLEMKLEPDESIKGDGRGSDAELIVMQAIGASQAKAREIIQAIDAEEQRAEAEGEYPQTARLEASANTLIEKYEAMIALYDTYKAKQKGKGKEDTLDKVKGASFPILEAAFALAEYASTIDCEKLTRKPPAPPQAQNA